MLRIAMPVVQGRGAGLGNELITWSKAFIGGKAIGARILHPAWGLNKREYWRYFQSARTDYLTHSALRMVLPYYHFDENEYRENVKYGFEEAVCRFAEKKRLKDLSSYVVGFSGIWGGFDILWAARPFIVSELLKTKYTIENIWQAEKRIGNACIRIGIHIRRGDFYRPSDVADIQGHFNVAIPLEWYENFCEFCQRNIGNNVKYIIVSDASEEELKPLTEKYDCVTTKSEENTDVSDLLLLSWCDFILCSVSSFSAWAAFISNGYYGWYRPNLVQHDGFLSIWGNEPLQQEVDSETAVARRAVSERMRMGEQVYPRGIPVDVDGALPYWIVNRIIQLAQTRDKRTDLIRYGAVPIS